MNNKHYILGIVGAIILLFSLFHNFYSYRLSSNTSDGYQSYEDIPLNLQQSLISIEDRRFFYHPGIDLIAVTRAVIYNISLIRNPKLVNPQGASTIDQQLIKLSEQAFTRSRTQKIREMRYALNLQFHYSKFEIFVAYINSIPFSHGITGRKSACTTYFQKSCDLLNDAELSYLLAVSQLGINPYREKNQETILQRSKILCEEVGSSSTQNNKDTESTCSLLSTPQYISLSYKETPLDPRVSLFLEKTKQTDTSKDLKDYLVPPEKPKAINLILSYTAEPRGFKKQDYHHETFNQQLYSSIQSILITTKTLRQQYNVKDCCIVIVDKNGNLISMNMCSNRSDPEAGKINLCLEPRQTGSAIKPFLYLYAMMTKGIKATDTIIDEPVQFNLGNGNIYEPKNFDLKHHGKVTLAYALGNSLNVPAIKLTQMVGVAEFLGFLKEQLSLYASGYDHNNKNPENVGLSVGLGTYEISPYAFTKLRTLFLHDNPTIVLAPSPSEAVGRGLGGGTSEIISILSNPSNKVASFGQDSFLNTPGRAVKTGTSRKFIDGRVCGVHPKQELSMCIWMGNYNNEAMKGASSEVASYVWNMLAKVLE